YRARRAGAGGDRAGARPRRALRARDSGEPAPGAPGALVRSAHAVAIDAGVRAAPEPAPVDRPAPHAPRLMPSSLPPALPLLGQGPWFWAGTNGFLPRLARAQGDVAVFRLGARDAFLLSHPDQVRRILVDDAAEFRKGHLMRRARRLLGDGLLTSEGRHHQT